MSYINVENDIRIEFSKDINVYINNIKDDMSEFSFMGTLVGKEVIFENIGYSKNHFWRCRINK